ncbi:hypothetical protein BVY03_04945 [bacterium K02(2017)]|nr:hypothetical protein BVY03_04945 [bacterium K02(2017)]
MRSLSNFTGETTKFCKYCGICLFFLLLSKPALALQKQSVVLKLPKQVQIKNNPNIDVVKKSLGEYRLYFGKSTVFPIELILEDLFGVKLKEWIKDPSQFNNFKSKTAIVSNQRANPIVVHEMPQLCPRAVLKNKQGHSFELIYQAKKDIINHRPTIQLFDPDVKDNVMQKESLQQFDDKNILQIKKVLLTYDYEDDTILDYDGPHPVTGKPHLVYEGQGGFYANLHYAVIPYDPKVKDLDRQTMLNLVQGKLKNINRQDLTPPLRLHSFIPGPYLSKDSIYPLCEWGDTHFQAKEQVMHYQDLNIWDWDMQMADGRVFDHLIVIVWEGDEEAWMIADKLLDPFYLTDDLVAVFEIKRKDSLKPITLINKANDFELTLQTKR